MARIRSIKPEFYRHEGLQDLEAANPGAYVMLVFSGLWGHCDKAGRFRWKPRHLKLDILPFLDFDMASTLKLLQRSGFIRCYRVGADLFGDIPTFCEHQRLSGKEAQEPEKYQAFPGDEEVKHEGSTGEAPIPPGREGNGVQEGKGKGEVGAHAPLPLGDAVGDAVEDWNALAADTGLPAIQKLTTQRRRALADRLRDCGGIEGWRAGLAKIRGSPFLLGRTNGKGHADWRADFDFIIAEKHFTKLMEGGYDERTAGGGPGAGDKLTAGLAAAFADCAPGGPAPD